MSAFKGNRLLVIIGVVVTGVVVVVLSRGADESTLARAPSTTPMAQVPSVDSASASDGDTAAETVKTLTAKFNDVRSTYERITTENEGLQKANEALQLTTTSLIGRLESVMQAKGATDDQFSSLRQTITTLTTELSALKNQQATSAHELDEADYRVDDAAEAPAQPAVLVWVDPLDANPTANATADTSQAPVSGGLLHTGFGWAGQGDAVVEQIRNGEGDAGASLPVAQHETPASTLQPRYTIARNSTLIGATAMTALVGRVPVDNTVQDALPFKVLLGADNLAANGFEIPGVFGMVFSGKARGDWNLGCVQGDISSVTYIFDDQTVRTLSREDFGDAPLGWLSDDQGYPCVAGERISTRDRVGMNRVLLAAAQALSAAAAASETTTQTSALTNVNSSAVTGDSGRFIAGRASAEVFRELRSWVDAQRALDAVLTMPGAAVAVHMDVELHIDHDPQGRKLTYKSGDVRDAGLY